MAGHRQNIEAADLAPGDELVCAECDRDFYSWLIEQASTCASGASGGSPRAASRYEASDAFRPIDPPNPTFGRGAGEPSTFRVTSKRLLTSLPSRPEQAETDADENPEGIAA